jgi:hypothetical protein
MKQKREQDILDKEKELKDFKKNDLDLKVTDTKKNKN